MNDLVSVAAHLRDAVDSLRFAPPVHTVYNPLTYAWETHRNYLERFGVGTKEVVLVGMNPGPWGMTQTGVPFGEVEAVRDWMGVEGRIEPPAQQHQKRAIEGFECRRSEVSGRRLWGWAQSRFGTPERFFTRFLVLNFCPLAFLEESGRNRTPDKLPRSEREPLDALCLEALRRSLEIVQPRWAIGVGAFAERRVEQATPTLETQTGRILHPSPASPAANRGWVEAVEAQLEAMGVLLDEPVADVEGSP